VDEWHALLIAAAAACGCGVPSSSATPTVLRTAPDAGTSIATAPARHVEGSCHKLEWSSGDLPDAEPASMSGYVTDERRDDGKTIFILRLHAAVCGPDGEPVSEVEIADRRIRRFKGKDIEVTAALRTARSEEDSKPFVGTLRELADGSIAVEVGE
jgi:hypothetical protein